MNADWKLQIEWEREHKTTCFFHGADYMPCDPESKMGVALPTLSKVPTNGLRHPKEHGTNGWYIWGGEYSSDPEFFQPLCAKHLETYFPEVIPYLGLAPGWRFLIAPKKVDVWFDPELLNV